MLWSQYKRSFLIASTGVSVWLAQFSCESEEERSDVIIISRINELTLSHEIILIM